MTATTPRRALLQGALALPAGLALASCNPSGFAAASVADTPETPVLRLYREHQALGAHLSNPDLPSAESERLFSILVDMEHRMECEPATCIADLAAKVVVLTNLRVEFGTIYEPGLLAECEAIVGRA